MTRRLPALAAWVALALVTAPAAAAGPTRYERAQKQSPTVREAFSHHAAELERAFRDAGAAWPPRAIYLRAMKYEGELELWAAPAPTAPTPKATRSPRHNAARPNPALQPRVLVRTFHICAKSGVLGPKVQDGDGQVPEGLYRLEGMNGAGHLSLGISYPNAVDRARAGARPPGGDIFIHGGCVTVGCIPIQDDPIEALYVVAVLARGHGQPEIPVHLFPCRFDSDACATARREAAPDKDLSALWRILEAAYVRFEASHLPPAVRVTSKGYLLEP